MDSSVPATGHPDSGSLAPSDFRPRARRRLTVFGSEAELVWLPERGGRPGFPGPQRPAFREDLAERILANETVWRGFGLALTPNRFPFAGGTSVLWAERPTREHDEEFCAVLFSWTDATGGTALVNNVGAAASIARAHAHSTTETLPFLGGLDDDEFAADWLPDVPGVRFVTKRVPFLLVGVRGDAATRAKATAALQQRRMTAACNLVATRNETWIYPRSAYEIPAPHFPYALGSAELWGRWCYVDEDAFANATAAELERALVLAGSAPFAN